MIRGISGLEMRFLLLRNIFLSNLLAISSFVLYNRYIVQGLRDLRGSV